MTERVEIERTDDDEKQAMSTRDDIERALAEATPDAPQTASGRMLLDLLSLANKWPLADFPGADWLDSITRAEAEAASPYREWLRWQQERIRELEAALRDNGLALQRLLELVKVGVEQGCEPDGHYESHEVRHCDTHRAEWPWGNDTCEWVIEAAAVWMEDDPADAALAALEDRR